jgi:ATP/maltotriose-dependent transcriptional regulator MalT
MASIADVPESEVFELLVGAHTADGYLLTVVTAPAGDGRAVCRLDPLAFELQDTLSALQEGGVDAELLVQLGSFLFEELFPGEVAALYRASLSMVRAQQKQLQVRLRIEPAELAALPWEYLYDAHEEAFLALSPETALVRYIPLRLPIRPLRVALPLRILAVLANPYDLPELNVAQERATIEEALAPGIARGEVVLEVLEQATVAHINRTLRAFQPHVFHFVGHGIFAQERACLALEDDQGQAYLVDEQIFREFFAGNQETRVAVLNACQSATLSASQPQVGLAPRLLQRQLSAVVAMQLPVRDSTALAFTHSFYHSLALGYGIDTAVAEARKGIFQETSTHSAEWGAPVLFMRARDGRIFDLVQGVKSDKPEIPPPPEPARPPAVPGFVGRQTELDFYGAQLRRQRVAIIAGMAGVGKTSLAAVLASQLYPPDQIFWHSFRPNEGLDVLIWKAAGFLAWRGKDDLWRMLQATQQNGSQPPPLDVLFDYVLQMVRGAGYLLCLDDFHFVDEDPLLDELVDRLRSMLQAGELALLLTSRRLPPFLRTAHFRSLGGLTFADTQALLAKHSLSLEAALIQRLHNLLQGNVELLILAIDALQTTSKPARLVERLTRAANIERYLLDELDRHLNPEERQVEGTVAVLNYPCTRGAIEGTLAQRNLQRTLYRLCERYLLIRQPGEEEDEYHQHALLRAFYYEQLDEEQRQAMHRRAAEYYESEEPDLLRAAWHYLYAGEQREAATLAANNVWTLINRGHVQPLRQLLEQIAASALSTRQWAEVNLARGEVYTFLGKSEEARAAYETAEAILAVATDSLLVRTLRAQIYLGMGDLLRDAQPQEAYHWFQRGLTQVQDRFDVVTADLLVKLGSVAIILGRLDEALALIQQGLDLLPDRPNTTQIGAQENLGVVYFLQGKLSQAIEHWGQGETLSRRSYNQFKQLGLQNNLAVAYLFSGEWQKALATLTEGAELAEQLGSAGKRVLFLLNLGILHTRRGDDEAAHQALSTVLQLAEASNLREYESHARFSLADLHLRQGEPVLALSLLAEAERISQEAGVAYQLPEIRRLQAEAHLVLGQPEQARAFAEQAVHLAQQDGMTLEEGSAHRVLGQVLAAIQQGEQAGDSFQRSLTLLGDSDPYECARTKLAWGRSLPGEEPFALQLLQEAYAAFQELGAARELLTSQLLAAAG